MAILYNRYLMAHFIDRGLEIGGRQEIVRGRVEHPVTMRVNFTYSTESQPNEGTLTIINLSPQSQRDLLVEGERVEVVAGYWPWGGPRNIGPIFAGQIRKAHTKTVGGTTTETVIELGDSDDAYAHAQLREVFPDADHETIVRRCLESMVPEGVRIGRVEMPGFVERRIRTVDRLAREELDDICRTHDLQWYIQDGVANVYPRDNALQNTDYILEPQTGVIDAPEFSDKGANFRTLMLPDLRPGFTITLQNDQIASRFSERLKIESVNFQGSNAEGFFGAQVRALYLNGDQVVRTRERHLGATT